MGTTRRTNASPWDQLTTSKAVAVPVALCTMVVVLLLGTISHASADTTTTSHHTLTASAGGNTNVAAGGTLTSLSDGETINLHVVQASPSDPVFAIQLVRQCADGIAPTNPADLNPTDTGNCIDVGLGTGQASSGPFQKLNSSDTFIDGTFKVGVGSRDVAFDAGNGSQTNTITCDSTHPCSLWVQIARTNGSDLLHFELNTLGTASTTTTTTAGGGTTTTTASGGSTTTTAGNGSTTTTAGNGSTTTTAGNGSTTTTAGNGSTTTTTIPCPTSSPSTTLPQGTTVTPCGVKQGGSVVVSSSGWKVSAAVTFTLHSDPIALGTQNAGTTGIVAATVTIPATAPAGFHVLELTGQDTNGNARTVDAGVNVVAASSTSSTTSASSTSSTAGSTTGGTTGGTTGSSGLAVTGSNVLKVLLSAMLIGLAGWLLLVSAVHRRDRLSSTR